jgi:hypothetical protein
MTGNNYLKNKALSLLYLLTILLCTAQLTRAMPFRGLVIDTVAHGVPGATVQLYEPKNGTLIYSIQADASGYFAFPEVMERDYLIRITAPTYPDQWFSHWANTIYRQYTTRIDIATIPDTLFMTVFSQPQNNPPNNTLIVTLADSTGSALANPGGIYVTIIRRMDYFEFPGTYVTSAPTVTFDTLQAAEYYILIRGAEYPQQFYDPDRNTAMPRFYLSITNGETFKQTVRIVDPPAGDGEFNGICLSETDTRISGVTVELCQPIDTFRVIHSQTTDAQGKFSFLKIVDMDYYVKIYGNGYPVQWFSKNRNATTRYPDDMVWPMHFAGDTVPIRLSLHPIDNPAIGSVSIVVRDSTGKFLAPPGVVEFIDEMTNLSYTPGFDSPKNRFVGSDLPTGKYSIKLNFPPYPSQFYSPAGNTVSQNFMIYINPNDSFYFDTKMVMNPGQSTTQPSYGFLTGVVHDSSGPVDNALINIVNQTQSVIQSGVTIDDGTCKILRIPVQDILIVVQASGYPPQFWSPKGMTRTPSIDNKVFIAINDTFYFDAHLLRFPDSTGTTPETTTVIKTLITGKVRDLTSGKPLSGVRVVLFDQNQPNDVNTHHLWSPWERYTDTSGTFSINNIPPGMYRCMVEADSMNYVAQFYPKTDILTAAKIITIDSASSPMVLEFSLRRGGIFKGTVATASGAEIGNARIEIRNSDNSRWFETWTADNGTWTVAGIPRSTWHIWVNHDVYLPVDDNRQRDFEAIEGSTISIPTFAMEPGGYLYGTFSSPLPLYDSGSGNFFGGNCLLFNDSINTDSKTRWPDFQSGIQFDPNGSTGTTGNFRSTALKPGNYRICYSPQPRSWNNPQITPNTSLLPGLGYAFIGSDSSTSLPQLQQILPNDSTANLPLVLRKGYSIFGTIRKEDGSAITDNFGVEAMVKRDSLWFLVSHGSPLPDGRFELPGLVDDEDYYLAVWADGYHHQFWSPNGNTMNPEQPFRFKAAGYVPLALKLSKNPSGIDPSQISGPLSLWMEGDSLGFPLLKWESDPSLPLESYTLYSYDRTGTVTSLTTVPRSSTVAGGKFRDTRVLAGWRDYIVVGKGAAVTVRSNRNGFDPRGANLTSAQVWLDVFADRWGVELEWGIRNDTGFAATDSINVYKAVGSNPFQLIFRRPAWQMMLHDDSWDRSDSGKTYTFYVEIPSRGLVSQKVSIVLDAKLFAGLAKVLMVGPYEQYQRISDAVAAASDFDHIDVRPGTYIENISLKGKILSLNGSWDFGKPPVIDGGGGIAITIPVCTNGTEWDRPRISGFIIRNSSTGIKSMYHAEVSECLFDNVSVAVSMSIDSTGLSQQLKSNPFKPNTIEGMINHCTFIARRSGNLIASATAAGIAEQPGYSGPYSSVGTFYLTPNVSLNSRIHIDRSNIAFYQSSALQTTLPVTLSGNSTRIKVTYSNFWKTATTIRSTGVELMKNNSAFDPQFTDSSEWFVASSSPLAGTDWDSWTGYDSRRNNHHEDPDSEKRPSSVRNSVAVPVGLNAVVLRWSAAPAEENVTRYRIYRLPGNPSLFRINQQSQWEPTIPEDSLFSIIDSFSTTGTSFLDTTVTLGKSYLYVVAAINKDGVEGEIALPAPPDISSYFVNAYAAQIRLAAGKWHMIGIQGGASVTLNPGSPHLLFDWDDKRIPDKTYAQYGRGFEMKPAAGYWFKPAVDTVLAMNAASLNTLKTVESTLRINLNKGATGWNLISSPFPFSISPDWLTSFTAWEWNADSLGYRKATMLRPWKAYWVFSTGDTALQLWKRQPLSYYQSRALSKTAAPSTLWQIQLSLQRKNSFDTDNFIGVVPAALGKSVPTSTPKPPAAFEAARLFIVDNSATSALPDQLAQLFKTPVGKKERLEWIIGISPSQDPSELTIHHLENLPEELFAFWVEENRVINIREQDQIPIAPKSTETFGYIIITANPADLALFSSNLVLRAPFPNPFKGTATIEYVLPYSWAKGNSFSPDLGLPVKLSIFDIRGNQITRLVNTIQKPGIYRIVWNGHNSSRHSVAAGMYLMKLQYGGINRITRLYRIQ